MLSARAEALIASGDRPLQPPLPHRPAPIRLINAAGRALARGGIVISSLKEESLLRAARKKTGLSDFGAETFRPGLRALLHSLEHDAALSAIGRAGARQSVIRQLVTRLELVDYRKRHPELADERIERPLFVLGLPRTGTTILYGLLAQDPAHRAPLSWEVAHPCPPPETSSYESDPRIEETDRELDGVKRLAPGIDAMHPIAARLPQECIAIVAQEFVGILFQATFNVPSHQRWLDEQDLRPAYRWHRQVLQHLQSRHRGERWVLKTPGHLSTIEELFSVYPDAMIVQTHRDPTEVMASVSSIECKLRGAFSDQVDPVYVGAQQVDLWSRYLRRGMRARERHPEREGQFFDLHFEDLLADPLACVRRIYAHFRLELSGVALDRMRRFLVENPRDKHGVHRYTLDVFGLERAEISRQFADYCGRFGLASGGASFRRRMPAKAP